MRWIRIWGLRYGGGGLGGLSTNGFRKKRIHKNKNKNKALLAQERKARFNLDKDQALAEGKNEESHLTAVKARKSDNANITRPRSPDPRRSRNEEGSWRILEESSSREDDLGGGLDDRGFNGVDFTIEELGTSEEEEVKVNVGMIPSTHIPSSTPSTPSTTTTILKPSFLTLIGSFGSKPKSRSSAQEVIDFASYPAQFTNLVVAAVAPKAKELVSKMSWSYGKDQMRLNVVQQVIIPVCMGWICDQLGFPLKTKENPRGLLTPLELYDTLCEAYTYIHLNYDPTRAFKLRNSVNKHVGVLKSVIGFRLAQASGSTTTMHNLAQDLEHVPPGDKGGQGIGMSDNSRKVYDRVLAHSTRPLDEIADILQFSTIDFASSVTVAPSGAASRIAIRRASYGIENVSAFATCRCPSYATLPYSIVTKSSLKAGEMVKEKRRVTMARGNTTKKQKSETKQRQVLAQNEAILNKLPTSNSEKQKDRLAELKACTMKVDSEREGSSSELKAPPRRSGRTSAALQGTSPPSGGGILTSGTDGDEYGKDNDFMEEEEEEEEEDDYAHRNNKRGKGRSSAKAKGKRKRVESDDEAEEENADEDEEETAREKFRKGVASKIGKGVNMVFPSEAKENGMAISAINRHEFFLKAMEYAEKDQESETIPSIQHCRCSFCLALQDLEVESNSSDGDSSNPSRSIHSSVPKLLRNIISQDKEQLGEDGIESLKEVCHRAHHRASAGDAGENLKNQIWELLVDTLREDLKSLPKKLLKKVLDLLVKPRGGPTDGVQAHGWYPPSGSKKRSCWTLNKLEEKHPGDKSFFSDILNCEFPIPYDGSTIPGSSCLPLPELAGYDTELAKLTQRLLDLELVFVLIGMKNGTVSIHSGVQASNLAKEAVEIGCRLYSLSSVELETEIEVPAVSNKFGSYSAGFTTVTSLLVLDSFGNPHSLLTLPPHWCSGTVGCKWTGKNFVAYCGVVGLDSAENLYEWIRTGGIDTVASNLFALTAAPRPPSAEGPQGLDRVIEMCKLRGEEILTGIVTPFGEMPEWCQSELWKMVEQHYPDFELVDGVQGIDGRSLLAAYCRINAAKGTETKMNVIVEYEGMFMTLAKRIGIRSAETKSTKMVKHAGEEMTLAKRIGIRSAETRSTKKVKHAGEEMTLAKRVGIQGAETKTTKMVKHAGEEMTLAKRIGVRMAETKTTKKVKHAGEEMTLAKRGGIRSAETKSTRMVKFAGEKITVQQAIVKKKKVETVEYDGQTVSKQTAARKQANKTMKATPTTTFGITSNACSDQRRKINVDRGYNDYTKLLRMLIDRQDKFIESNQVDLKGFIEKMVEEGEMKMLGTQMSKAPLPFPAADGNPTALIALGSTVPLPFSILPPHLHPDWSPLEKTLFSMMVPQVEDQLEKWKTESVVLFGIESHVCVLQTALDCLDKGIDVHVLADGVSSCNGDEVGIALKRMRDAGAMVTTSESALFQLIHDSKHPAFRSLVGLVKETKEPTKEALKDLIAGRGF
ncbi:hypothetical protein JCM5353_007932 [Sporobolomyces roseus]